jgi:outer membrane protein OmpA-like peptidoglycan-associated protein
MYILERRGLGESAAPTPARAASGLRSGPPYLRFDNLDRFEFNKASLTNRLRTNINNLATAVKVSWSSSQPINFIRLVGHTDSSGEEAYNRDLGKRRAEAVQTELQRQLTGLPQRVLVIVDPSPGKSKPTADNGTADGRARNRRVEVFVTTDAVPPPAPQPPPPAPPIDLRKAARDAARKVEEEAERRRQEQIYNRPVPARPPGRSLSDWLDEVLNPLGWIGHKIRDAVLKGACQGLEILLSRAGARLNEKQKEDLRKQCLDFANRPL